MKETPKQLGKIGGLIAVASIGMVALTNYLLPIPTKQFSLWWDTNGNGPEVWYELWSTTDMAKSNNWYMKCRVQNTNHVVLPNTNGQEFFAIRAGVMYLTGPTNKPVTNWMYSENIRVY